jgi:hypothetical protein
MTEEKTYKTKVGFDFKVIELQGCNPYANRDGSSMVNKLVESFAWLEAREAYQLDQLSPKERKKALEEKEEIQKRMNS